MNRFFQSFLLLIIVSVLLFFAENSSAEVDLSISVSDITFSKAEPIEKDKVRIFVRVFNLGDVDVYGFVIFTNNGQDTADPQPISVKVNTYDDVFIDWVVEPGTYDIKAEIVGANPRDDNQSNDIAVHKDYFIDLDTDGDRIGNTKDLDDDDDGISDEEEKVSGTSPLNKDTDGDGVGDKEDVFPLDSSETKDNDGDGVGNNADIDDDNDGLFDEEEKIINTDPFNPDTDQDEVYDKDDVFPLDSSEWQDSDRDNIGDNKDEDDDNDGLTDEEELFVFGTNPLRYDTDNDGFSDKEEVDSKTNPVEPNAFSLDADKLQAGIINIDILDSKKILAVHFLALLLVIIFFFHRKRLTKGFGSVK